MLLRKVVDTKLSLADLLKADFSQLFSLDYPEFISVMHTCIPESLKMKGKANVSAEGVADKKPAKNNVFGLTEDEEIRAFSGLLRFKDVISGTKADYDRFVACQIEMKKPVLSFDSFKKMGEYVKSKLNSAEDYAAAMWSILCNDLGKVHAVIDDYRRYFGERNIGHDALLAEMIKHKPETFQGFYQLPAKYRERIMLGYASGCDISQLEQLELPVVALQGLLNLDAETLELYYIHTIFDVSGAAAHFKPNGSLTMHQETWNFFATLYECVKQIPSGKTTEQVYADYLHYRGECVGIKNESAEATALIRIAGQSRLATPEQGQLLLTAWEKLLAHVKNTLVRELNVHGAKDERSIFIGYAVAMLLNSQGALKKELGDKAATVEGLRIGLTIMAKAFEQARKIIGNDKSNAVFVAECAEVAKLLSKEPGKALNMEFDVIKASDGRRVDFTLSLPKLQQAAVNTATLSAHVAQSVFAPVHHAAAPVNPPAPAVPKL